MPPFDLRELGILMGVDWEVAGTAMGMSVLDNVNLYLGKKEEERVLFS